MPGPHRAWTSWVVLAAVLLGKADGDVLAAQDWTGQGNAATQLLSPAQQAEPSPEQSESLVEKAEPAGGTEEETPPFRLELDTIELERLYEALREEAVPETLRLSVEDCVRLALEKNQDILITQYGPWKAEGELLRAWGEFDPVLGSTVTYVRAEQRTSSEIRTFGGLGSIELFRTSSSTSLGGKLPWGTTYNLALNIDKEETTYNRFIEEWSGGLTLTLTQPLLRGRGRPANLAFIRAARNARVQAEDQLRFQVMAAIAEVIKAYWDLVGAVEALRVREGALANAERLLAINERRYEMAAAAALEVLQAKAGVASRQSDLFAARSQALDAGDVLKNLLSIKEDEMLSPARIAPVDQPSLREAPLEEAESVARALENRPDIHAAQVAVETARIELKRAANGLLPQLDVTGSAGQGGRGHYLTDVFDGVRERMDRSYSVGIRGAVPIGNRAGRGAYHQARLAVQEAEQRLEKTKQDVMLAVRLALRGVATSRILVESNRQARALQETNVAAEERRLQLGVTTSFEVLRVQEDLTAMQVQELHSIIAYEKSLVDLRLAEGVLLEELGIIYEPDEPEPVSYLRSIFPPAPH